MLHKSWTFHRISQDFYGSSSIISSLYSCLIIANPHCSMHHDSLTLNSKDFSFQYYSRSQCWKVMKVIRGKFLIDSLDFYAAAASFQPYCRDPNICLLISLRGEKLLNLFDQHFLLKFIFDSIKISVLSMMRCVFVVVTSTLLVDGEMVKSQILSCLIDFWMVGVGDRLLILRLLGSH
jgi:hypothetical protein